MKITRRQIRKIIREEKAGLLKEMYDIRDIDIERAEGLYFQVSTMDQFVALASKMITDAMDEAGADGLDGTEAYGLVMAVVQKLVKDAESNARF